MRFNLKTAVGTEFEVKPKRDAVAWLPAPLSRISALPNRDCQGAVTKINYSALHRSGDNCFSFNHLALGELANSRRSNCRFQDYSGSPFDIGIASQTWIYS
jgi:hypothetical protein